MKITVINQTSPGPTYTVKRIFEDLKVEAEVNKQNPIEAFNSFSSEKSSRNTDLYVVETAQAPHLTKDILSHIQQNFPDSALFVLHRSVLNAPEHSRQGPLRRYYKSLGADGYAFTGQGYEAMRESMRDALNLDTPLELKTRYERRRIIQSDSVHFCPISERAYLVKPNHLAQYEDEYDGGPSFSHIDNDVQSILGGITFRKSAMHIDSKEAFEASPAGQYYAKCNHIDLDKEHVSLIEALYSSMGQIVQTENLKRDMYKGPFYPTDKELEDLIFVLQKRLSDLCDSSQQATQVIQGSAKYGFILNDNPDDFNPGELFSSITYAEKLARLEKEMNGEIDWNKELHGKSNFDFNTELHGAKTSKDGDFDCSPQE